MVEQANLPVVIPPQDPPPARKKTSASVLSDFERRRKQTLLKKASKRLLELRQESLRLYESLPHIEPFHACAAPERVLRGSNRSGKTLGAAVEFARAVTSADPYKKYPATDGRAFVVGKDGKHNSEVLYRKLFRRNAFRIIKDAQTGLYRSYRPWTSEDAGRDADTLPAPPLIPRRLVEAISWENKRESLPNVVLLKNGWEIRFFSSLGKPPQGSDIDIAWFDEEIVDPEWYNEISARLIDRHGKFFWSATAQKGGLQLFELCQMAQELRVEESPRVVEIFAHIDQNTFFSDEQRQLFADKLSEDEQRIRIEGEFAFLSYRVYPEFDMKIHGVDAFSVPEDWCRYLVVDPGRQVCAVLFAAVPPPEKEEDTVYIYDELYIRRCDSKQFGEQVASRAKEHHFHSFIIDSRGARTAQTGSGVTIERQYSDALREHNISSETTGHGFYWANDDVLAGINAARSWMNINSKGRTKLRVLREKCPNLEWEIARYHYKRVRNLVTDQPDDRHNHLMDCLRYLAMYDPAYYRPRRKRRNYSPLLDYIAEKRRRAEEEADSPGVRLGPAGG